MDCASPTCSAESRPPINEDHDARYLGAHFSKKQVTSARGPKKPGKVTKIYGQSKKYQVAVCDAQGVTNMLSLRDRNVTAFFVLDLARIQHDALNIGLCARLASAKYKELREIAESAPAFKKQRALQEA